VGREAVNFKERKQKKKKANKDHQSVAGTELQVSE
jgi:hypothetical protein